MVQAIDTPERLTAAASGAAAMFDVSGGWPEVRKERPMYAIAFDMDIEALRSSYGDPSNAAYSEIGRVLRDHGFTRQQGSVYFGDPGRINAVTCVLAATDLARRLPWFSAAVRDIRMLRIEEQNDLMPAVNAPGS